jgi:hypothetical protein
VVLRDRDILGGTNPVYQQLILVQVAVVPVVLQLEVAPAVILRQAGLVHLVVLQEHL